jgi:hypothetical protein
VRAGPTRWDWVNAAGTEGVAAKEAAEPKPAAAEYAPLAHSVDAIVTASWTEFAASDQERRERDLVATDKAFGEKHRRVFQRANDSVSRVRGFHTGIIADWFVRSDSSISPEARQRRRLALCGPGGLPERTADVRLHWPGLICLGKL